MNMQFIAGLVSECVCIYLFCKRILIHWNVEASVI